MLSAGNQSGKTHAAAMETAYHATGIYPKWWKGRRFTDPVKIWIGSQSYAAQRQAAQSKLLGTDTPLSTPDAIDGGALLRSQIFKITPTRGVADSIDTIIVKHKSGGYSTITFKTYDQEIAKWAGGTIHVVWMDEEPPMDLYTEAAMRTTATKGIIYTTYTPLNGRTPLYNLFTQQENKDRAFFRMTAYEVGHLTKQEVDDKLAGLPEWERDARIFGLPAAGEGKIVLIPESTYKVVPIELKHYWPRIIGLDIGMLHPTAAVWLAWDRDRNMIYAYDEYRLKGLTIGQHAASLLMKGAGETPVAWPQDATQREHSTGDNVVFQYKKMGLAMMQGHARSQEAGNALWPSITDLLHRLQHGTLKIFANCTMLLEELMSYHHDKGKVVALNDDLISALRYGVMMHKQGQPLNTMSPAERAWRGRQPTRVAKDALDLDPFY